MHLDFCLILACESNFMCSFGRGLNVPFLPSMPSAGLLMLNHLNQFACSLYCLCAGHTMASQSKPMAF